MVNMAVPYARPNRALLTLRDEVYAYYGRPARDSEFVTGYKSVTNITGHNADANGIVHAIDIFVGPGNLTEAQGIELAEFLRAEGPKGWIDGHPDRLYYIIHRGRIAGDWTNWEWVPYGGSSPHTDHIHVSTCDLYWGDPAPISSLDYDSTAPWGVGGGVAPQGSTPTIIKEDELSEKDVQELKSYIDGKFQYIAADGMQGRNQRGPLADTAEAVARIEDTLTEGKQDVRHAGQVFALLAQTQANSAATLELVRQVAAGQGVTIDLAAVEEAARKGAASILDGVKVSGTIGLAK